MNITHTCVGDIHVMRRTVTHSSALDIGASPSSDIPPQMRLSPDGLIRILPLYLDRETRLLMFTMPTVRRLRGIAASR